MAVTAASAPEDPSLGKLRQQAQKIFDTDFPDRADFTIFYPDEELKNRRDQFPEDWWRLYCHAEVRKRYDPSNPLTSFEFQETVNGQTARLQISRANNGLGWSITARWTAPKAVPAYQVPTGQERDNWLQNSKWKPCPHYDLPNSTFVVSSIRDVIETLYELIMQQEGPQHGLILVTGSTNSAKSEVTRGLVWKHLNSLKDVSRRLHLVTYEDPIEKDFAPPGYFQSLPQHVLSPPFDVTQRGAPGDCASLDEALTAALRQTPDAFYIGEIRNGPDLFRALEFGGTGHLVLATAHAGSLIEALTKLLRAAKWEELGSRAIHIPKVLAVVHLKRSELKRAVSGASVGALVPALYRRTSSGMQELISDGLASILPYFPDEGTGGRFGSLGRQFLASRLITKSELLNHPAKWPKVDADAAKSEFLSSTLEEDLNG